MEVVDKDNVPHRGSYELIQVSDRQPYTVGFGADTLVGERIRTLLVGPGLYRIVRPGSNYRARTDFSTVLVPEGSARVLQAGPRPGRRARCSAPAWYRPRSSGLSPPRRVGIGATRLGSACRSRRQRTSLARRTRRRSVSTSTFDFYISYDKNKNYFSSIFELEEGLRQVSIRRTLSALPLQKTNDRLRFDLLYTRFLSSEDGSLRSVRAVDERVRVERARDRAHVGHEEHARRLDDHRTRGCEQRLQGRRWVRAGPASRGGRHQLPARSQSSGFARLARGSRCPPESIQRLVRAGQLRPDEPARLQRTGKLQRDRRRDDDRRRRPGETVAVQHESRPVR